MANFSKNLKEEYMKKQLIILQIILLALSVLLSAGEKGFKHFITTKDGKLFNGKVEYRFVSWNIPNLNFVEDEMVFEKKHAFRLPDEYELRDAMESVDQLGGKVIRSYTIPVIRETDTPDIPRYVLGPNKFDEESFKCMDQMLAIANETGIRLIVPLLNNWKWMGGVPQYAGFRGKEFKDFWRDPQLIDDFKKTIDYVLNRTNTITGIKYKDDKSILCWETGNELQSTPEWASEICKYIKSVDKNHLVMDGFHSNRLRKMSIEDPNVDIVTTHHYESHAEDLILNIQKNIKDLKGKKPYILGEFGFLSTVSMAQILDEVIETDVSGALIWSLRSHRREGGFYWHSEPLGLGFYKAYHFPGFPSGEEYDEINLVNMMREKAYKIQGKELPDLPKPKTPVLLLTKDLTKINWQGSVGASAYDVQRADSKRGPWQTVGFNISDAKYQYTDLFNDKSAKSGKKYFYRVIAKNISGESAPSNIIGPLKAEHHTLVDHMDNVATFYDAKGKFEIKTDNDRIFKEDMYRLEMQKEGELVYYVTENIKAAKIYSYSKDDENVFEFFVSRDNKNYMKIDAGAENFTFGKGDYNYQNPILYTITNKAKDNKYLKIKFKKLAQISRIEIKYGN